MEKKTKILITVGAVVLLVGASVGVYAMTRKGDGSETAAIEQFQEGGGGGGGWVAPAKSEYTSNAILNTASAVEEVGNNKLKVTLSEADRVRLFGQHGSGTVYMPKPTGTRFKAAPELLAKLSAKHGAGEVYQKGKNISEGFDYITVAGQRIPYTMKDFFDLAKSGFSGADGIGIGI